MHLNPNLNHYSLKTITVKWIKRKCIFRLSNFVTVANFKQFIIIIKEDNSSLKLKVNVTSYLFLAFPVFF